MTTIFGYILLGIYHAVIVIPMFYIIPQALIIAGYLFNLKKWNKKYIQHFVINSGTTFITATIITHLYFLLRPFVNVFESISIIYTPLTIVLMLLFVLIPFLPIPISYYVNKRLTKKKERKLFYFSAAYFFYALLLCIFFIKNSHSVYFPEELLLKPLLVPNLVNFTEIFDILQSRLFLDLFTIFA